MTKFSNILIDETDGNCEINQLMANSHISPE